MLQGIKITNWAIVLVLFGLGGVFWLLPTPQAIEMPLPPEGKVPKSPFTLAENAYLQMGEGPLSLREPQTQLLLPDLRTTLVYQGKNGRPDIHPSASSLYIGLKEGEMRETTIGERVYLSYDRGSGIYHFSHVPTALWIVTRPADDETLHVDVGMTDPSGSVITTPLEHRRFALKAEGVQKNPVTGWDLGGHRVDTTLLVRQRARWVGEDLFLARHGGKEFAHAQGRQRIDFATGEIPYSCFVQEGDFLVWKEGRWIATRKETIGHPLLVVKKMNEKVMTFDLWNPEGSGKLTLSLIRAKEGGALPDISREFQLVGAKSWTQFIVECRGTRMVLRSGDWLVLTKEGWRKLSSAEEIDAYVNQTLSGPLLILDQMAKQSGRQVLVGRVYNALRTEEKDVELSTAQSPLMTFTPQTFDEGEYP